MHTLHIITWERVQITQIVPEIRIQTAFKPGQTHGNMTTRGNLNRGYRPMNRIDVIIRTLISSVGRGQVSTGVTAARAPASVPICTTAASVPTAAASIASTRVLPATTTTITTTRRGAFRTTTRTTHRRAMTTPGASTTLSETVIATGKTTTRNAVSESFAASDRLYPCKDHIHMSQATATRNAATVHFHFRCVLR